MAAMATELHYFIFTLSLLFFSLLLFSSPSAAQLQYFINCGSAGKTTFNGQTFIGDSKPKEFKFSGRRSYTLKNTNQSAESIYQTARVFRNPSTYQFEIPESATYNLRFHFYPFSSSPELANSQFNVSASGHLLLFDFTIDKNASNFSPVKEFFLRVNPPNLRIHFVPQTQNLAFVNAIEILPALEGITEDSGPHVTPEGKTTDYKGQKSKTLEIIYRIDVGAQNESNDDWIPDDRFLMTKAEATNSVYHATDLNTGNATDAPMEVYKTAKKSTVNVTWQFNVTKGATYFVRAHFCDIVNLAQTPAVFNIYFYDKFAQLIDPYNTTNSTPAIPFYKDFIVDSNDLGFINVGIGPNGTNTVVAFLNGLEILQIKEMKSPDPGIDNGGRFSSHLGFIVGMGVVGLVMIMVVLVGVVFVHRRGRKTQPVELIEWGMVPLNAGGSSHNRTLDDRSSSRTSNLSSLQLGLKIPFAEIQQATNNFDSSLIIGEGGFGKVYKGTLRNGVKVAVKRSNPDHGQGLDEFLTEIMVLSRIRYYHLVSLIGYCYEEDEMILIYEFMEKGSLRDHLYDSSSSSRVGVSWKQRLEICIGAAKGLHYLHTGLDAGIIHRDVKSTNILLDQNYVAKVADFGLSRSQHLEKTHVSTEVKGTFGYLDPEYFTCLQLTEKSDVYSFGVLLFEVLCARTVIDRSLPREQINLAEWAKSCYRNGCLESIIDPSISGEINPNSLKKYSDTGMKCLNDSAVERPPMSDVLWDLEYALQIERMAAIRNNVQDESMSMTISLPFPAVVRRFPSSQSFVDDEEGVSVLLDTSSTAEVFSQLSFEQDGGR